MSNFFLLNEAINLSDVNVFKDGMAELVSIKKEKEDLFLKHESIYNLPIYEKLCINYGGLEEKAISIFIEQLKVNETYINNEEQFDKLFEYMSNAFLGINFLDTTIERNNQISNESCYLRYNEDTLWKVTFRNFWSKREKLFPRLILCGEVKEQILRIGKSSQLNQIVNRLKEFNRACEEWKSGKFNYREINKTFALTISPESPQTIAKYGNERIFSLPNGGTEHFELHIKTGDFRFHFFVDDNNRRVYIGYIGPHLSTVNN